MKAFPFTAISAQEDFKLALILCMIDPSLGGVLALGDKGTGKTTTVRGLSNLMPDFPFVNLPIGATEDRVLGTMKLDTLINEKRTEVQKGLLAAANHGVLYIDEVNLLNDYLMDVLLDAASSGGYYLERDHISQWLESKFCLVGTMNPEEGELRPQLLDRFGLSVTIKTPMDKAIRMEIVNRRLLFDADPAGFCELYKEQETLLSQRIVRAKSKLQYVILSSVLHEAITDTCIQYQVEGLRADILLMKAARAHAAWYDKKEADSDDVHKVMSFILSHRSKNFSHNKTPQQNRENQSPQEEKEGETKSYNLA
ncbi:protoporphyrin IX magnesium-chelatase [Chitinophaga sp. CF118]|uniref:ATP-binding protein n=1 Tax=Chitinophaga sp. CF118 TaxID=1884367 RepID=UPI0008DEC963|nr:AAA family ATPase [Chitinophaga sp. CF118]SFD48438.1 protoporphyrin IX magnesium-chelatase [Chitinophaga sp. CF118]